jgi:transposase
MDRLLHLLLWPLMAGGNQEEAAMKTETVTNTSPLAVIGGDIGKEVFHLVGLGGDGRLPFAERSGVWASKTFEALPACIVGMEACLSAHFVNRVLRGLGHEWRIIPAIYTKPFGKGQKNDYNAEAIAEAALRPNLRMVQEKRQDQPDLQACHRVRSRRVSRRTATINQIRALPARPAQVALCRPGQSQGRDIPAHDPADPRTL